MRKAPGVLSCKWDRGGGASPRPKPPPRKRRQALPRPQAPAALPHPLPPFSTANPANHGYRPVDRRKCAPPLLGR